MLLVRTGLLRLVFALALGWAPAAEAAKSVTLGHGWMLDTWTRDDGLPVDHIETLAVDDGGILWLGTVSGLVRFDGVTFRSIRASEPGGPPSDRIRTLVRHPRDGSLWVVTDEGVLQRRSPWGAETFDRPELHVRDSPSPDDETIWALAGGSLLRLDGEPKITAAPVRPEHWIWTQPGGDLELIDAKGLGFRREPGGTWTPLAPAPGILVLGRHRFAADGRVASTSAPAPDSAPRPTGSEVPALDGSWGLRAVSDPPIQTPWGFDLGNLLFRGRVVTTFSNRIESVTEQGDAVWIATVGDGLARVRPADVVTHQPPDGRPANVQRLWVHDGSLWAHGELQGWWKVRGPAGAPDWRAVVPPEVWEGCPEICARPFVDTQGSFGLGCRHKLLLRGPGGWEPQPVAPRWESGPIWNHGPDLWAAGVSSLSVRRDGRWTEVRAGRDPLAVVRAHAPASDGALWLGGKDGVFRVEPGADSATLVAGSPSVGPVRALLFDAGTLWAGTEGRGLCVVPPVADEATRCLSGTWSGGDGTVHAILDDGRGRWWVSTNDGLAAIEVPALRQFAAGGDPPPARWFRERHGMRSAETNGFVGDGAVRTADGHLWFATQDGVVEVDPSRIPQGPAPSVLWTSATLGGLALPTTRRVDLTSRPPELRLEWTTAAGPSATDVEFRYRRGTAPWSTPSPGRSVVLIDHPAGDSRFEVQARAGGAWGPASGLDLHRRPRLQETALFPLWLAFVLAALAALVFGVRSRVLARLRRTLEERVAAQGRVLVAQNADLQRTNADLVARSEDLARTADELRHSEQQQAGQARQLAHIDRVRRGLLEDLSHELGTPLSLIVGPLGALLDSGTVHPAARPSIEAAMRTTARFGELVEQLFALSRSDEPSVRLRLRRTDLADLAERVVRRFEPLAAERDVRLSVQLTGDRPRVWLDRDLIDKVLSNLLANAARVSPRGAGIALSLSSSEGEVRVEVEDEGPGVPEELRALVFERYVQGPKAASAGKAGLGLALARHAIEQHGGEIGVENRQRGACFHFTLPLGVDHIGSDDVEPGSAQDRPSVSDRRRGGAGARPRILLVEDDESLLDYLCEALSSSFEVWAASDGFAALAHAEREPFDLLVSDIGMVPMDGHELVRRMRGIPGLETVPVLLLSGSGDLSARTQALSDGRADDYVRKPFAVTELVARAEALVRRSRRASRAPAAQGSSGPSLEEALRAAALPRLGDSGFGAAELARTVALSLRALQLKMQEAELGTPSDWLRRLRLAHAHGLLRTNAVMSISEAAAAVGMSRSYFSRVYAAEFRDSSARGAKVESSLGEDAEG